MYAKDFETYEDYLNEEMCGGAHIDECLTEEEWNKLKQEQKANRK